MPKSQKKNKDVLQSSIDELDESLLLGEELEPTKVRRSRRKSAVDSSLLEDELLGDSPVVLKKSKRRKTQSSRSKKKEKQAVIVISDDSKNEETILSESAILSNIEDILNTTPDIEIIQSESTSAEKHCESITLLEEIDKPDVAESVLPQINEHVSKTEHRDHEKQLSDETHNVLSVNTDDNEHKTEENATSPNLDIPEPQKQINVPESPSKSVPNDVISGESTGTLAEIGQKTPTVDDVEVDIYSDLSNDNDSHTAEPAVGGEVTYDEIFKMTDRKETKTRQLTSEKEEEDLDYEDYNSDVSQMRISVLVSQSGDKSNTRKRTTDRSAPIILPPLPHAPITIPPMLPLPPVLPTPPPYLPTQKVASKRKIYINPRFKTEIILKNLEDAGILKGGNVAVHIKRRTVQRSRSRSPIKCHTSYNEYVPLQVLDNRIELDAPTTTLLITELSACTTRSRIKELFSSIGLVKEVLTFPHERRAVVTFEQAKDAVVCRRKFHRSLVDGSYMNVNFAI